MRLVHRFATRTATTFDGPNRLLNGSEIVTVDCHDDL